jgi:hypothetical protein
MLILIVHCTCGWGRGMLTSRFLIAALVVCHATAAGFAQEFPRRAPPSATTPVEDDAPEATDRFVFDPPLEAIVRKTNNLVVNGYVTGISPDGISFMPSPNNVFTYPAKTVRTLRLARAGWTYTPDKDNLEDAVKSLRQLFPPKPKKTATGQQPIDGQSFDGQPRNSSTSNSAERSPVTVADQSASSSAPVSSGSTGNVQPLGNVPGVAPAASGQNSARSTNSGPPIPGVNYQPATATAPRSTVATSTPPSVPGPSLNAGATPFNSSQPAGQVPTTSAYESGYSFGRIVGYLSIAVVIIFLIMKLAQQ